MAQSPRQTTFLRTCHTAMIAATPADSGRNLPGWRGPTTISGWRAPTGSRVGAPGSRATLFLFIRALTITTPCAGAFCGTEELPDRHRALVELGHRLINQRGPEIVRWGREPSGSPAS